MRHTQLQRYLLGQSLGNIKIGEIEFFPLRDGESPSVAKSRVNSLLRTWRTTFLYRWSCRANSDGVVAKRIGTFNVIGRLRA